MPNYLPPADDEHRDPIERVADAIARENVDGVRHLLPPEMADDLEEIIAVALAHQPNLRRMTRRLVPDPIVAGSGDVVAPGVDPSAAASDTKGRATGSQGR